MVSLCADLKPDIREGAGLTAQYVSDHLRSEHARQSKAEADFDAYARSWLRDFESSSPAGADRAVALFARSELGFHQCICSFITPVKEYRGETRPQKEPPMSPGLCVHCLALCQLIRKLRVLRPDAHAGCELGHILRDAARLARRLVLAAADPAARTAINSALEHPIPTRRTIRGVEGGASLGTRGVWGGACAWALGV